MSEVCVYDSLTLWYWGRGIILADAVGLLHTIWSPDHANPMDMYP